MSTLNPDTTAISTQQLARHAYVYVRQSTPGQVLRHGESTDLQYALVDRAVALGWPRDRSTSLTTIWGTLPLQHRDAPASNSSWLRSVWPTLGSS